MNLRIVASSITVLLAVTATQPASAESLKELSSRTHYHGIAFARSGTATLLLATHHGIFVVDHSGEASLVSPVHDFMGFSPHPADPLTYYASGHPAEGGNSGFLKSSDGGATWTQMSEGAGGPVDFHQMDVSPANASTIFGNYGGLQVSHDGGATWSVVGPLPPDQIAIAASAVDARQLYAGTKSGVHISTDGGVSWQLLAFGGEIVSTVETGGDGALYAFVLGRGLLKAQEAALSDFSVLADDLGQSIPLHLAVDPKDGMHLALTTQNSEVLESRDGGASWMPFPAP